MTDAAIDRNALAALGIDRQTDRSWGLAWRLARRELRSGLSGFRIFLACLILGVGAMAAVGVVSQAMLGALTEDAQTILGADIELRLAHRPAGPEQRAWLDERSNRLSELITMRTMARATDEQGGERRLVELKAVDNLYPMFGALRLAPAMSPEAAFEKRAGSDGVERWGAVAERRLLDRLGVAVGDPVRIGDETFELRAAIEHEPDKAGNPFGFGPRLMLDLEGMQDTGLLRLGSLYYHHYRIALPEGADVVYWKQALDADWPDGGWRIRDFRDASPGVRHFVQQVMMFLTLVGLTALLVGGVGIGNAVRAYLESRTGAIAALKCLGAATGLIFRIYFLQILILAGLGVLGGLGLGLLSAFLLAELIRNTLPLAVDFKVFLQPLGLAALFGLLTALVFSIGALARARDISAAALFRSSIAPTSGRMKPRDVSVIVGLGTALAGLAIVSAPDLKIAVGFVVGSVAAFVLFRLLSAVLIACARRASRSQAVVGGRPGLRLALANLHRPGAPTASLILSLGLGLTVLTAIVLIQGNLAKQVSERLPEKAPSFYFIDLQPDQVAAFDDVVAGVSGPGSLLRVPSVRGRIVKIDGEPAKQSNVAPEAGWALRGDRGLTYAAALPEGAKIVRGDWWPEDYSGPPLISMDETIARGFGVEPGDTLTLNILGRKITATIANTREIDWAGLTMNFTVIFAPGALEKAPHSFIATVHARAEDEERLYKAVTDAFSNVSAIPVREALETVREVLGHIGVAVRSVAAVTLLAGVLVLAGAVAAGHRRRVYDAVVLKVLGARRWRVIRTFCAEYGTIGLASAAIATVLGALSAWSLMTFVMKTEWIFLPTPVAIVAFGATAVTIAGGLVGAWRALGQPSAPFLRNE